MQTQSIRTSMSTLRGALLRRGHILFWSCAAALFVTFTTATTVAAATAEKVQAQENGPEILPVLLPLAAAAASVERAVELLWNYLEWILIRFFRWRPKDLKSASYVQFKSGTSLLVGLFLGIIVANFSGMRLLGFLQPMMPSFLGAIPAEWDIILTGIVIGAGAKPAHDILGIITHLKNFTASSAVRQREQAGAALADGMLKMSQADSPYNVDVPGVGPKRVAAGPARGRLAEETGEDGERGEDRLARYADTIHDNLYIGP